MSSGRKDHRSKSQGEIDDIDGMVKSIKEQVEAARSVRRDGTITPRIDQTKATWESLKRPVAFDKLSKWVSDDDFEWAKSIGIYVYPKGFTREGGVSILAPQLLRALKANLPEDKDLTAQDISLGVLSSIVSFRPNLGSKDLVRVFALVLSEIGFQYFPHLLKLQSDKTM